LKRTWGSTDWGKTFTKTEGWRLTLDGHTITIEVAGKTYRAHIVGAKAISAKPGIFWSEVSFTPKGANAIRLDGIPNSNADEMLATLRASHAIYVSAAAKKQRLQKFDECITPVVEWHNFVGGSAKSHKNHQRWIPEETLQSWLKKKPSGEAEGTSLSQLLQDPNVAAHLAGKPDEYKNAVSLWKSDLRAVVTSLNENHLRAELIACKDFFNKVENSPLTEEQAKAVVCFDNRVLIIASAGSGKTSTMVAKAGYALHRGLVSADRILLLAFNADAAKELQSRILERLIPLGFPAEKIVARTFHAFGLDVIGKATGKKPTIAPWLEHGGDIERLSDMVDALKDRDTGFRTKWDLFRVVFSRDLPKFGKEQENHEDWDRETKETGFRTLNGEVVKSHSERLIADWLFYNGVKYRYEPPYEVDTADPTHRQYRPDFYYPDANAYHEHFALNEKGKPPPEFKGYLEGVQWKRALHKQHGTVLIETTSADLRSGKAFKILDKELKKHRIVLDPNPDRPVHGRKVIEQKDLVNVFRTFLTHAKSNQLNNSALRDRLERESVGTFTYRHEMFLDLFETVRAEWENCLKADGFIDFEDMLNLAADHLESANWQSPYDLVMVDEFQDASHARARLTRALVNKPNKFLSAVGDDWQSINRFAGSDISVMTGFESWFGKGHTLRLERTFRCPQSLCDVSSQFVLKNPAQIQKRVASTEAEYPPTIQAFQVEDDSKIQGAIDKYLSDLCRAIVNGEVPEARKGKISVFVLGRYRKDRQYLPSNSEHKYGSYLTVSFSTVHGSKGLEADYVILPRVVRGAYSFPSTIEDDPVLQLAMPSNDTHPFAEERRLFYVALTRARRSVVLMTVENRLSEFIIELAKDKQVEIFGVDGKPSNAQPCPECKTGSIVQKNGKYGPFQGCNNFPKCRFTVKTPRGVTSTAKSYPKTSARVRTPRA
jgi:DNA helicase-4